MCRGKYNELSIYINYTIYRPELNCGDPYHSLLQTLNIRDNKS